MSSQSANEGHAVAAPSPKEALKWLFPKAVDRRIAVELLCEAIRVAHAQRSTSWALSLKRDSVIRLNAGRAEVFALFPDLLHFNVDRTRVPSRFGLDDAGKGLASIPDSAALDLDPKTALKEIDEFREAWHAAIRTGAMSATTCPYAKFHSPALIEHLRENLGPNAFLPEPERPRSSR